MFMRRRTSVISAGLLSCPLYLLLATATPACAQSSTDPLPACEWCGAQDAPEDAPLTSITIAGPDEPGERIRLVGRIYESDAETPAAGVLVYAYHTDADGVYRTEDGETGNGRRHGVLRGWLRTGPDGRYEIRSVKPAPYPNRSEPAHVHTTLTPPGGPERWLDSTVFLGDPLLSDEQRARGASGDRFSEVVDLVPDEEGVLVGRRDIVMPPPRRR